MRTIVAIVATLWVTCVITAPPAMASGGELVPKNLGAVPWKPAAKTASARGWVMVGGNDTFTIYADLATLKKSGNAARMWTVTDFKKLQVPAGIKPFLSMRQQMEYACDDEQVRWLSTSFHDAGMASGKTISSDADVGNWQLVAPGSAGAELWALACGRSVD